jgi:hypothetical protein
MAWAVYELVYYYENPPRTDWGWYPVTAVICSFYFFLAWAAVRLVAWIISGFIADIRKNSN